jgi:GLPGLI family protein
MNQRLLRGVLAMTLTLLLVVPVFAQGFYWESTRSSSLMGDTSVTVKYSYAGKKFKVVSGENGKTTILRLDKEVMIMLNPEEKTYWELSFADMEKGAKKASAQMDQKMAELKEKLKDMPEEQRKMMEQMMGSRMQGSKEEPKLEVVKSGDTKKISGYTCTKYVVNRDGKEMLTVWVTKDVKGFETIRKDMNEFRERMAAMNPGMRKGVMQELKNIEGFPMETEMGDMLKEVVTKVERKSIAASEFEIPEGYKKVESPMMRGKDNEEQ